MSRHLLAIGFLAILTLACSLGGSDTSEPASPEDSPSSGGVPISKSTPVSAEPTEAAPTKEGEPTPLAAPTQAPPPSPVPQDSGGPDTEDLPVAVVDLYVLQPYETSNPELIGLVQNVGAIDLFDVNLTLTFYDADGNVADTRYGSTTMTTLPAGAIAPFQFYFPQGVSPNAEAVGASIEWQEVYEGYSWTRDGLDLTSIEGVMGPFNFEISGVVTNNTGRDAQSVFFTPIAYNANGDMIGYSLKYIEDLESGASASFEANIAGGDNLKEAEIDHFEILVEALLKS